MEGRSHEIGVPSFNQIKKLLMIKGPPSARPSTRNLLEAPHTSKTSSSAQVSPLSARPSPLAAGPSFQPSYGSNEWAPLDNLIIMPHPDTPSNLPGAATAPGARLTSTHKTALRTYSRRSLKRRHTSPPAQNVERFFTRTGSLNVKEPKTAEQRNEAKAQQLSREVSNKDRKRLRFSLASAEKKTPSDLAWEALASSAPVLTRQDDGSSDDGGSHEIDVVKCSSGHQELEQQQPDVGDAPQGSDKDRDGKRQGDAAAEADTSESTSLEESDDVEDGEEQQFMSGHEHR